MMVNKIDKSISIVVPVYNSAQTLDELIERLVETLSIFRQYQIVLVNDNSKDTSFNIISSYAKEDKNIIAINVIENVGQQLATFLGLKYAKGDYVVIIDDDLAQNPEDIVKLYNEIEKGFDVVYGIKKNASNRSVIRSIGSIVRDFTFNTITKKPKHIKVSSFRILHKEIVGKILKANTKFIYISMEILKHTTNIGNIYVEYTKGTATNYNYRKLTSIIKNMYIYYSTQKVFKVKPLPTDIYIIEEISNEDTNE